MNKTWLIRLAVGWIALMAVLLYRSPKAEAKGPFELQEVYVTYRSFLPGGTEPMITQNPALPDRALGNELDLTVNINLFKYLYWNNTVHSLTDRQAGAPTDPGQFRMVGLEMGLGIDLMRLWEVLPVSVGYAHYSRHVLDAPYGLGHSPVEDSIEIKLHIYTKGSK